MKPFLLFANLRSRLLIAAFIAATATFSFAGDDAPSVAENDTNLARINSGAEIDCVTPDGRVTALTTAAQSKTGDFVFENDTLSCPLPEGRTTFVIKLPAASVLGRFTFVNENAVAAGDLKISVSNVRLPAASEKWMPVDGRVVFSHKRLFNVSMLGVEAHYVKLEFTAEKAGRVAALGLYGAQTIAPSRNLQSGRDNGVVAVSNKTRRHNFEDSLNFDYANVWARARVVYVSSGALSTARRMIDDDPSTGFNFAANDSHPLAIIELAQNEPLHRVRALYSTRSGRLDVYVLNELHAQPSDLRDAKLIATVDDQHTGKAVLDFDPQGARFIALRWTPDGRPDGQPFEVAEINAFGSVPVSMASLTAVPESFASLNTTAAPSLPNIPLLPQIPVVSP